MGLTRYGGLAVSEQPGVLEFGVVSVDATAGAITLSIVQFFSRLLLRDPNGAGRADLFPTAAAIVAAIENCVVGQQVEIIIRNTADAAETITMTTNTGLTLSGTMTIAQNNTKTFIAVVTNVITPAVTIYSVGTFVH